MNAPTSLDKFASNLLGRTGATAGVKDEIAAVEAHFVDLDTAASDFARGINDKFMAEKFAIYLRVLKSAFTLMIAAGAPADCGGSGAGR